MPRKIEDSRLRKPDIPASSAGLVSLAPLYFFFLGSVLFIPAEIDASSRLRACRFAPLIFHETHIPNIRPRGITRETTAATPFANVLGRVINIGHNRR